MPAFGKPRPYVLLNSAMSLDGKTATFTGDSHMSSPTDIRRVHHLRASVDSIMVGLRTVLRDDPKLTVKFHRPRITPTRIIVDSKANTPLASFVVRTAKKIPTIIAVTSAAPETRTRLLEDKGVNVLVCGKRSRVSLNILLRRLGSLGVHRLLLEGGGELNWSMISQGLVDEITVAITPRIVGGSNAPSLADGEGFRIVKDAVRLKLLGTARYGPDLVARYKVLNRLG